MRIVAQKRGKLAMEDVLVMAVNLSRRSADQETEYLDSIGRQKEEMTRKYIEDNIKGKFLRQKIESLVK